MVDTPTLWSYTVTNHGTGPAQFFSVDYFIDSKPVDAEELKEGIRNYLGDVGVGFRLNTTLPGNSSALSAGESIDLVAIQFLAQEYGLRSAIDPSRFRVRIGYKSSLGGKEYFDSSK